MVNAQELALQKIRIALVEDHLVVRKGVARMLEELPELELVFDAANGQEFLNQLAEKEIDVVLLDLEMPVMNGYQTLKELKKRGSAVKIVMLTMHDDFEIAHEMLQEGVDAYLLKECSIEEMLEAIQQVHIGATYSNAFMNKTLLNKHAEEQKRNTRREQLQLNERELMILKLICDGRKSLFISEKVHTSKKNIDLIRTKLMQKLNVSSANELIRVAILHGFYTPRTNVEIENEQVDDLKVSSERRLIHFKQNGFKSDET
jgi:DNA-binding NarL/FixJ family response regulator